MKNRIVKLIPLITFTFLLSSCVTALPKAENGGCANEDFLTQVSGGGECLSILTELPTHHNIEQNTLKLVVTVHGDNSSRGWEVTKKFIPELDYQNTILVHIKRPGYAGSTGTRNDYGFGLPVDKNNLPVMEAINRLKTHYKAKTVKAMGNSGGSNILATGSALYPQYAPDELLLSACGCNLQKTITANGWNVLPGGVSAHEVAHKTPKHMKVFATTGTEDRRTPPNIAKEYIEILKENKITAAFIPVENRGHMDLRMSDEFKMIAKAFLIDVKPISNDAPAENINPMLHYLPFKE